MEAYLREQQKLGKIQPGSVMTMKIPAYGDLGDCWRPPSPIRLPPLPPLSQSSVDYVINARSSVGLRNYYENEIPRCGEWCDTFPINLVITIPLVS